MTVLPTKKNVRNTAPLRLIIHGKIYKPSAVTVRLFLTQYFSKLNQLWTIYGLQYKRVSDSSAIQKSCFLISSQKSRNEPSLISLNETEVAEPEPTDELVYDGFYGPTTHAPRRSGTSYSPRLKIVEFSDSIAGFHIVCRSGGGCGDLFESLDALIYHVKTYHGRKQKENTFECYYCKKNVADRHSVERHMNAVHTSHSMFKCPFPACPRSFNRQFNLKRHIKCIHTKKKKHECTMCTMKYYYKHLLTNHSANEHGKGSARPSQKLVSLVKCSTKANSRPRLMRTKSRELES